jgi:hypothetical protein
MHDVSRNFKGGAHELRKPRTPRSQRYANPVPVVEGTLAISFAAQIRPLFREGDRNAMLGRFDLWAYADVVEWADRIDLKLTAGLMPCDGVWVQSQIDLFKQWIDDGKQPRDR